MTELSKQEELQQFVNREVFYCQSMLVDELLKKEVLSYDDITNLYMPCNECDTCKKNEVNAIVPALGARYVEECEETQPQEIYEWWIVSEWLLKKLIAHGEPALITEYGSWWGRTGTGQSIALDYVIEKIYEELKTN